jgi:hypothetical protein
MIKKGNNKKQKFDSAKRAKLIRKGNELFLSGDIETAKKIFITVDYKDGLVRLGDHYLKINDIYKSAEMYFMSENKSKIDTFCKKCALVIEKFLKEDKKYDKIIIEKK